MMKIIVKQSKTEENLKEYPKNTCIFTKTNTKNKKPPIKMSGLSGFSRNRTRDTRIFSPLLYQLS